MLEVLIQMAGLILCGIVWQMVRPAGLDPAATRTVLTSVVYYLMLPALVLSVLWEAELGAQTLQTAAAGIFGILIGLLLSIFTCRACHASPAVTGAIVLAAAFPNVTYLGLPVLEATYGSWSRSVAIQYDLFAATPMLFTIGILVSAHYGHGRSSVRGMLTELRNIPALWAALLAVLLNVSGVPMPSLVDGLLGLLERGVVPLMLISLGLSLKWDRSQWHTLPSVVPVAIISLLVIPAVVYPFTGLIGLEGEWRSAVVLEAAMPCMVLGLVLCDRFDLDTTLYATAVTVTTALSLVTLPLWYGWMSG
jgi:predicted permease